MATAKERNEVITVFRKYLSENKIDHPVINSYTEQWTAAALIDSYGKSRVYELIKYYFEVSPNPNWEWFSYNIKSIDNAKTNRDEDIRIRAKMKILAKEWLEN